MKTGATKTTEILQPLVSWRGTLHDTRRFRPAELEETRKEPPLCPVCKSGGTLDLRSGRPLFVHSANHQAETPLRNQMRGLLGRWLHRALPGSTVRANLPWQQEFLDLALLRSDGAKLALQIISEEPSLGHLQQMKNNLLEEQTALLLLLDPSRLPERFWKDEAQTLSANFRRAECELLRLGSPLLYMRPDRRDLLLLEPPRAVMPLLEEKRNLGSCPAEVHHYRLSELRLRKGEWFLDRSFDQKPPKEAEPNKRLLRRLEELSFKTR